MSEFHQPHVVVMLYDGTCCSAGCPTVQNNQLSGSLPPEVSSVYPPSAVMFSGNCIANASSRYVNCDLADRVALVDLFVSTSPGSTQWANAVSCGWLTNTNPCSWAGVQCDTSTGPVKYVRLGRVPCVVPVIAIPPITLGLREY